MDTGVATLIGAIVSGIIGGVAALLVTHLQNKGQQENLIKQLKSQQEEFTVQLQAQRDNLNASFKQEIAQDAKMLSAQYITDKRVDWIYAVRNTVADYVSTVLFIVGTYRLKSLAVPNDILQTLNALQARLRLYFNFAGPIDGIIINLTKEIVAFNNADPFNAESIMVDIEQLTGHAQIYLKLEWERIKLEIKGTQDQDALNSKLIELAKEYYEQFNLQTFPEYQIRCPYSKSNFS